MPTGGYLPPPPSISRLAGRLFLILLLIVLLPLIGIGTLIFMIWNAAPGWMPMTAHEQAMAAFIGMILLGAGLMFLAALIFSRRLVDGGKRYQHLQKLRESIADRPRHPTSEQLAQLLNTTPDKETLLKTAVELMVREYDCSFGALYLFSGSAPATPSTAEMVAVAGGLNSQNEIILERCSKKQINLDATPTLGWLIGQAIATHKPAAGEFDGVPYLYEVALPLLRPGRGSPQMIGLLNFLTDIRTRNTRLNPFNAKLISEMQASANILASAVIAFSDDAGMLSSASTGVESDAAVSEPNQSRSRSLRLDPSDLFTAGSRIARAETQAEVLSALREALRYVPYVSAVALGPDSAADKPSASVEICRKLNFPGRISTESNLEMPDLKWDQVQDFFQVNGGSPLLLYELDSMSVEANRLDAPADLFTIPHQLGCRSAAYIPAFRTDASTGLQKLSALLMVGALPNIPAPLFRPETLQPFSSLIEFSALAIERINTLQITRRRLVELETLWNFSRTVSTETDFPALLRLLHTGIESILGSLDSFAVGLYDSGTNLVSIPYMIEDGQMLNVPSFPLGSGLSSVVIHSREPLILTNAEAVKAESERSGAYLIGEPARSWLGVPMLYGGEVVGLIIVQDTKKEGRFQAEDVRLLSAMAAQVAGVVRNLYLLEGSRRQAEQERLVNDISDRIRRAVDLQSILKITTDELGQALQARRAVIKIHPPVAEISADPAAAMGEGSR